MLSIGWFSTGRDKAARQLLQTVLESIGRGDINAKISFVFSSRELEE
jgi:phosphoribosylglycinamide formyltransferase-1